MRSLRVLAAVSLLGFGAIQLGGGVPAAGGGAPDETLDVQSPSVTATLSDCDATQAGDRGGDNSDATLCDGGDTNLSENYSIRYNFATPASSPSTGTDEQAFECRFQKSSSGGAGDPTVTMEVYCGGSQVDAGSTHTVGDGAIADYNEPFTFNDGSCTASGVNLQLLVNVVRIGPAGSTRRSIDTVDCDWLVTY